jgi:hypothetical protein
MPSGAHAIQIKTTKVTMPVVKTPQLKTPQGGSASPLIPQALTTNEKIGTVTLSNRPSPQGNAGTPQGYNGYIVYQFGNTAHGNIQWSNGGAPAGGGGGVGKVRNLNPNGTVIRFDHQ